MRKYAKWLGHWKPEYDAIRSENELVLMVGTRFSLSLNFSLSWPVQSHMSKVDACICSPTL